MSGVSNAGFRVLARRGGAARVFTETLSARGLLRWLADPSRERRTPARLPAFTLEPGTAVQLFGGDPAELADAGAWLSEHRVSWIDLNAGCPVDKFIRGGAGAALLRTPERLSACVAAMRAVFPGSLSVKMRSGWDASDRSAPELARRCAAAGADLITVHGRTRVQRYRGTADYAAVRAVVDAVSVPVLANGDVVDAKSARRALRDSGASGLMIGRAASAYPWLFAELLGDDRSPADRRSAFRESLPLFELEFPDPASRLHPLRRAVASLVRGLPNARRFRSSAAGIDSATALAERAVEYLETIDEKARERAAA